MFWWGSISSKSVPPKRTQESGTELVDQKQNHRDEGYKETEGSRCHSTEWLPGISTCDTLLRSVKNSIMAIILCSNFATDDALIVYTYFLPFFSYSKIIQHCISLLYTMNLPQEKDKSKINHTLTDFTGWMGGSHSINLKYMEKGKHYV